MKARSITQTKNTMIELIMQHVSEEIEIAGSKIQESLLCGSIQSATEIIRKLAKSFEDLVWESYLNTLFQCKIVLAWLRKLGAQKALRFVSYQEVTITLPTGKKIQVRSPFFVKASPKKGRKKRGPQNRGDHLLLSLLGFVHKVEPGLAFRAVQLAVLAPSFDIAAQIFRHDGINLSPNKIRRLVAEIGNTKLPDRVNRLLDDENSCLLEKQRVLIAVDGGRLRQRKNKRGPIPKGNKRHGFHCDWIEPKLFTIHLIDEDGNIIKKIPPFVDGTTGKLNAFLKLLEQYFIRLEIGKASEVILVGDGAPWIWERIPKLIRETGGPDLKLTETIDWTHAKQNLQKAFESLPKKKAEQVKLEYFKELLFAGNISKIVSDVKTLFKMKASSQIMKKLKSYFVSNSNRMQYENNQAMKAPIGSGVIESAIRRVVNLRLKSPGSFWKLDFAEDMIYLRAQLLYGRWKHLKNNWSKTLLHDFKEIAVCPVS
jgi:hypothetical protein